MTQTNLPQIEIDNLIAQYTEGKLQEVIDKIQVLNKDYPNVPILFNMLGVCHNKLGNITSAVKMFENAITIKPDYADAYYNLGCVLKQDGQLNIAAENYKRAIALLPDHADAHNNLGNTLRELGKKDDAINCYEKVIAIKPNYAEAHFNLGSIFRELGKLEAAIKSFERVLTINPNYGVAQHLLNGLTGHTSKSPPREYVEKLFDDYAERFNDTLVNSLEYKLPFLIKDIILKLSVKRKIFDKVMDLGCGTGLSGKELRDISNYLTGIDLSGNMIAKANELNIYDSLIVGDIVEILSSSKEKYDLFIALDVLIYIGEAKSIFNAVRRCCNQNSLFIFSIETQEDKGYSLLKSARYTHSDHYILDVASNGFRLVDSQNVRLRKEKNNWIDGKIYILKAS